MALIGFLFISSVAVVGSIGITVTGADSIKQSILPNITGPLDTAFSQVGDRLIIEVAESNVRENLPDLPNALKTLTDQVSDRVVVTSAESNWRNTLSYPKSLLNDITTPNLANIQATPISDSSAKITWITDEFADSAVIFGTKTGSYTKSVTDKYFVKEHEILLTGLERGVKYYYRVESSDLSGNSRTSNELTFVIEFTIFLPFGVKD